MPLLGGLWSFSPDQEVLSGHLCGSSPVEATTDLAVLCACHAEGGCSWDGGSDQQAHPSPKVGKDLSGYIEKPSTDGDFRLLILIGLLAGGPRVLA